MANNVFAGAYAAVKLNEDEYNHLGEDNVRMKRTCAGIDEDVERQREQSRVRVAAANSKFEEKIEKMRAQQMVDVYGMEEDCEAACSKLSNRGNELSGLIENNDVRRQVCDHAPFVSRQTDAKPGAF